MRPTGSLALFVILGTCCYAAERVREPLDRGVIARPVDGPKVYVGWRLLESDPAGIAFNVYRRTGDAEAVKLNAEPVRRTTDFVDAAPPQGVALAYFVHPVLVEKQAAGVKVTGTVTLDGQPVKGVLVQLVPEEDEEGASASAITDKRGSYELKLAADGGSFKVKLLPADQSATFTGRSKEARLVPSDQAAAYIALPLDGDHRFQKVGIADLDGDGRYDFVIKQPNENIDPYIKYWKPSPNTYKLEAYRHDGKFLWRYDLGWAIERGIWYSPYVVYDLDGDGKAEVAVKTAPGDPRDTDGRVRTGPEYLTVLDGLTGKPITQVDWPSREGFEGQRGYNYASRNQLCVAYLDGKTPSLLVQRGTYNIMKLIAYQFRGGELRELWRWDNTAEPKTFWGQGAHWMHAADVDADGRDEVLLGSSVIDDDGTPLWTTGLGHPDHFYVGDIDPQRPGLEIYYGIERRNPKNSMCLVDARTGEIIWGHDQPTIHVHSSGLCSDIDPKHPGSECYSGERDFKDKRWLRDSKGNVLSTEDLGSLAPRAVYWDADVQRELLRRGRISDYQGQDMPPKVEGHIAAVADVLGDWREEIITSVAGELRIYTTAIPAADRRPCLMQDPIYRIDVLAAAMGYFQVPMTSYDLATGKQ